MDGPDAANWSVGAMMMEGMGCHQLKGQGVSCLDSINVLRDLTRWLGRLRWRGEKQELQRVLFLEAAARATTSSCRDGKARELLT